VGAVLQPSSLKRMLRALVKNNAGLLLIVASEVFYAFMHASVKVLTSEGESVIPILEVRFYVQFISYVSLSFIPDYIAQNGEAIKHILPIDKKLSRPRCWGCDLRFLRGIHVSSSSRPITPILSEIRYCAKIDNSILGPPGVRLLLLCRGFSGYALNSSLFSIDIHQFGSRFIGIFGVYYALQYLSLSDSIVLTFLSPLSTAIAGSLVLKERFKKGEAFAASWVYHPFSTWVVMNLSFQLSVFLE